MLTKTKKMTRTLTVMIAIWKRMAKKR